MRSGRYLEPDQDIGRWAPHEVGLVLLAFVLPLSATARPAVLGLNSTKGVVLVAAVGALVVHMLWATRSAQYTLGPRLRGFLVLLAVYTGFVAVMTFSRAGIPSERQQLFLPTVVVIWAFWLCEQQRPGSVFDIQYRASVMFVVYSVINGDAVDTGAYAQRQSFSHVLVGFFATLVLLVGYSRFRRQSDMRRLVTLSWMSIAAYVLLVSFSRAALVSFAAAVMIRWVFGNPRSRGVKVLFSLAVILAVFQYVAPRVVAILARGNVQSFMSATGRIESWREILRNDHSLWRGYGYAALHDDHGPDKGLYIVTQGIGAENALLQVMLVAGLVGVVLWLWLIVRAFKAVWSVRDVDRGMALSVGIILLVNALFSIGMSGQPGAFWWLIGLVALTDRAWTSGNERRSVSTTKGELASARHYQ